MNSTMTTSQLIKEYKFLRDINFKLCAGTMKGITNKQVDEVVKRLKYLHLELVARKIIIEKKYKNLGGQTASEIITRPTIHRPEKKKLGKKKKGGRRRR